MFCSGSCPKLRQAFLASYCFILRKAGGLGAVWQSVLCQSFLDQLAKSFSGQEVIFGGIDYFAQASSRDTRRVMRLVCTEDVGEASGLCSPGKAVKARQERAKVDFPVSYVQDERAGH